MAGWRNAVLAHWHTAGARNLLGDLGGRQHTAVAWLRTLADLQLHHLDLIERSGFRKPLRRKGAVRIPGSEIPRADLPDDVAAMLAVVGGITTLPGIMGEVAGLGALIESPNGIGAQGAEAHGRDVEHRGIVGPLAIRPSDPDAERRGRKRLRHDRMADPFEPFRVDIVLGSERTLIERH